MHATMLEKPLKATISYKEDTTMFIANAHTETNTCKHYDKKYHLCTKCMETCPAIVKYNDDNENNVPCDMASYEPNQEGD